MILEHIINGREQWKSDFEARKGALIMLCMECGANVKNGYTTDVTELENSHVNFLQFQSADCSQSIDV